MGPQGIPGVPGILWNGMELAHSPKGANRAVANLLRVPQLSQLIHILDHLHVDIMINRQADLHSH